MPAETIDRAAALARCGGDLDLLREVAQLFLDNASLLMFEIRKAVDGRDAPTLARAAHTLKGSVANFGADAASKAALRLEKLARGAGPGGEMPGLEEALATLEAEMERARPELSALASQLPAADSI